VLEKRGCDLIVRGRHGRTGLPHLLFGRIAGEVGYKVKDPVMAVKAPPPG
jgi:nucleotide-binding universal stress UspA family protein